jgi:hypothetical protein
MELIDRCNINVALGRSKGCACGGELTEYLYDPANG